MTFKKLAALFARPLEALVSWPRWKELTHIHRYKTLLIYPPHNQKNNDNFSHYGFLLRCDCGETKRIKNIGKVTDIFHVRAS